MTDNLPSESIRVDFANPMPVFPLTEVALLPHTVIPLHIFEPRYRQMVQDALEGEGQIAMGVFDGDDWKQEYHASPPIRPVVCVGQIIRHEKLPDGRFNVLLRGVCRARVRDELSPDGERLYREALLEPMESGDEAFDEAPAARERLRGMLSAPPLTSLAASDAVRGYLSQGDAPFVVALELIGMSILTDREVRYRLLEASDPGERSRLIEGELTSLGSLLRRAMSQVHPDAPKGMTWN